MRTGQKARHNIRWAPILERGAEIVREIEAATDITLTLRKLFYKLVAEGKLVNDLSCYSVLSAKTSAGRKAGTFPDLAQDKIAIEVALHFKNPADGITWFTEDENPLYRLDRTIGQSYNTMISCEKQGTIPFLKSWYRDLGIPIVPLGGNASVTTWQKVKRRIENDSRPVRMLYLGDYDSSGFAIRTRFRESLGLSDEQFIHVGLTREQVDRHDLPRAYGKEGVARSERDAFMVENGEDVQVELDALMEDVLRGHVDDALLPLWDAQAHERIMRREARQRAAIRKRLAP